MTDGHHPDGLTFEAITALQHEVDAELHRDGYPVPYANAAGRYPALLKANRDWSPFTQLQTPAGDRQPSIAGVRWP